MRTNNLGPNSPTFTWYNINNGKKLLMYHENAGSTTVGYCSEMVTGIDELSKGGLFTIAPNPFSSQATISFSEMGVHQFKIMDVLSHEICNVSFAGKQYVIEKGGMNKGVYFVQTMDENKNIITKKIIMQ